MHMISSDVIGLLGGPFDCVFGGGEVWEIWSV